jgi:hypothetical protein
MRSRRSSDGGSALGMMAQDLMYSSLEPMEMNSARTSASIPSAESISRQYWSVTSASERAVTSS